MPNFSKVGKYSPRWLCFNLLMIASSMQSRSGEMVTGKLDYYEFQSANNRVFDSDTTSGRSLPTGQHSRFNPLMTASWIQTYITSRLGGMCRVMSQSSDNRVLSS